MNIAVKFFEEYLQTIVSGHICLLQNTLHKIVVHQGLINFTETKKQADFREL